MVISGRRRPSAMTDTRTRWRAGSRVHALMHAWYRRRVAAMAARRVVSSPGRGRMAAHRDASNRLAKRSEGAYAER